MKLFNDYCKRIAIIYFLFYLISTVIFSFIYWYVWLKNPDYYVINNELNELPIRKIKEYLSEDKKSRLYNGGVPLNLNEILMVYREETQKLELKKQDATKLSKELQDREKNIEELRKKNLETAITNKIKNIKKEIEELKQEENRLEEIKNNIEEIHKYNPQIKISWELIELIDFTVYEINQKILEKELWFLKIDTKELYKSFDPKTILKLQKAIKEKTETTERVKSTEEQIFNQRNILKEKFKEIYQSRIEKLGFFDFLYFSVITSTTTGYGDIVPNHLTVRLLVIGQILVSWLIFGLILTWIAKSLNEKK